jgi:tetratricopeptide (TPR) repeat protein
MMTALSLVFNRLALLGLLVLVSAASIHADGLALAQKAFATGNGAYEKGDFETAEAQYRRAIDQGIADHKLYYNYANALFRQNKLGLAILYWEKAAKMMPDNADIAHNLRFARSRITDKNTEPAPNWLTRALWSLHSAYSLNVGLWAALGLFSISFAFLYFVIAGQGWVRGLGISLLIVMALGQGVLWISLLYKINQQESINSAIVLKPVLEVYSGPGDAYQLLARVHEGTKFMIEQVSGEWASVKLANGTGGWVRFADLGKI